MPQEVTFKRPKKEREAKAEVPLPAGERKNNSDVCSVETVLGIIETESPFRQACKLAMNKHHYEYDRPR